GAWIGHFFANSDRWAEVPDHLKALMQVCFEQSHYYRQWWYWGGEAELRVNGPKLELTSIPDAEWATVEQAAATFWDEIAAESEVKARVVEIIKKYNDVMSKAGRPYRYGRRHGKGRAFRCPACPREGNGRWNRHRPATAGPANPNSAAPRRGLGPRRRLPAGAGLTEPVMCADQEARDRDPRAPGEAWRRAWERR